MDRRAVYATPTKEVQVKTIRKKKKKKKETRKRKRKSPDVNSNRQSIFIDVMENDFFQKFHFFFQI